MSNDSPNDSPNDSSADSPAELLARWRDGDQQAATEIFHRYVARLTALARSRLSPKLSRRVDPEDLVQSVYRSFFRLSSDSANSVQRGDDLWALLAAMMIHKLKNQVRFHSAQKRSFRNEAEFALEDTGFRMTPTALADEPTPEEALALVDELEAAMAALEPGQRAVLQLRLQGMPVNEISREVDRSERTVRRVLAQTQKELKQRLSGVIGQSG